MRKRAYDRYYRMDNPGERLRGRKNTECMKGVRCVETGEEFESIIEAAEKTGVSKGSISKSLIQDVTVKGFTWKRI